LQGTLLTIAIAVILALVAALAGPFVVDWNGYRSVAEREASRLTGLDVRIAGPIDVRFLPAPRVELKDVTLGGMAARSLTVELSLGSLARGEWRATDIGLIAPKLEVTLDANGKLNLPVPQPGFDGTNVTVERLHIEDGSVAFVDTASGGRIALDGLWFTGDARTLAGPYRGEGAFRRDGAQYPYRISIGRAGDDGKSRVRLNIDPTDRPLSLEAEGDVSLTNGSPRFEGSASVARPVQLVALRGSASIIQPWRASAKVKASSASALLEQIEFLYGNEDQGVKLTGTAEVKLGAQPRIEGVLSARQLDLDRTFANADGTRPPPAVALRTLAQASAGVLPFPFRLGVGIDNVTLGGGQLASLRGDIESAAGGWRLSGFEFRAPGFSRVQLAGALAAQDSGVSFTGRADIDSSNSTALLAWLEGRDEAPAGQAQAAARPLKAQGDVVFASDRLAVERLRAAFDRETVEGHISYRFATAAQPAKLDADLRASELDLDVAQGFLAAALAGSALERPQDIALTATVGRATVAGIAARDLQAKMTSDRTGIVIERLAAADLGGAAITAGGRIALTPTPRGSLTADLDARDIAGVTTLIARYWPAAASRLREVKGVSKLTAALELGGTTPATLTLNGNAGAIRVVLNGSASAPLASLDAKAFDTLAGRFEGKIDADDTSALLNVVGLNTVIASSKDAGQFTFSARGPWRGEWAIDGKLTGGALDLAANGTVQPFADNLKLALNLSVKNADIRPALQMTTPLPASLSGKLTYDSEKLTLAEASASVAGSNLRGNFAVVLASPRRIEGDVVADAMNAAAILGTVAGFPASNTTEAWPIDPFRPGVAAGYQGNIKLRSARAALSPALTMREFSTALALNGNGATFGDLSGELAGGRLGGNISLERGATGLRASGRVTLTGADAAALVSGGARPAVSGKLTLEMSTEGAGLSPSALIGSLKGSGKVLLDNGKFAALDPRVFALVTQAVDRGLPIDGIRIRDAVTRALDAGDLSVKHAEAALQIANGQLRLQDAKLETDAVAFTLSGGADLTQSAIDARMAISGAANAGGARPDIFLALRGPWNTPIRSVDVSALTGWLTLRAIETQAKKLEAIENAPPQGSQGGAQEPPRPRAMPPRQPAPPLQLAPRN
jgi:large subunit ribosomal protein L24